MDWRVSGVINIQSPSACLSMRTYTHTLKHNIPECPKSTFCVTGGARWGELNGSGGAHVCV